MNHYAVSLLLTLSLCAGAATPVFQAPAHAKTKMLEGTAEGQNPFRLQRLALPLSQGIHLRLDPARSDYTGTTEIKLRVLQPTSSIEISGKDYTIERATLTPFARGKKHVLTVQDQNKDFGKLTLASLSQIMPGDYTLSIGFSAPFNLRSVGLYKTIHQQKPYLFTQFEDIEARRAFPVFDEPEYKIPYTLTLEVPVDYQVYANTPETQRTDLAGGWVQHQFAPTPPIPSYLLAMTVGSFDEVPIPWLSAPGRLLAPTGQGKLSDYVVAETPAILKALEHYFGRDYPYAKLDFVAVPEFPFGAMENPGLITYRQDYLLIDPEQVSQAMLESVVNVIAHELAHQWFGNLVTMSWWDDLWLNEAFASWMADKITAQLHPEFDTALSLPQDSAMSYDARSTTLPIRKKVQRAEDITEGLGLSYSKGSAVLAMVENWIGARAFQQGLDQYMSDFAFKNARAADLWNALEKSSGQAVPRVLQSYIEQSSFPLIALERKGKRLSLKQRRFQLLGDTLPEQQWWVPMTLRYGKGDQVVTQSVLLNEAQKNVTLAFEPDWIYPDAGAMGYYRWQLSEKDYQQLVTVAPKQLNARERLSLLSGAYHLLSNGVLSTAQFLPIAQRFLADPHPRVVTKAYGYLMALEPVFVNAKNRQRWQAWKQGQLQSLLKKYGATPAPEESESVGQLRANVLWQLGTYQKDSRLQQQAEQAVDRYFAGEPVDPLLINTYLSLVAYYGNQKTFESYKQAFENPVSPVHRSRILSSMGYFGTPETQQLAMDYLRDDAVSASDLRYLLSGFSFQPERHQRFQHWLETHYEELKAAFPPFRIPRLPGYWVEHRCDHEGVKRAEQFFSTHEVDNGPLQKSLRNTAAAVESCQALARSGQKGFDAFLASQK